MKLEGWEKMARNMPKETCIKCKKSDWPYRMQYYFYGYICEECENKKVKELISKL